MGLKYLVRALLLLYCIVGAGLYPNFEAYLTKSASNSFLAHLYEVLFWPSVQMVDLWRVGVAASAGALGLPLRWNLSWLVGLILAVQQICIAGLVALLVARVRRCLIGRGDAGQSA